MFDPYEQWLGLPAGPEPPDYFQLLGVSPEVKDPDTIDQAARKRIARIRTKQDGPRAKLAARLLQEIKEARATLLDPAKRKAYKAQLRSAALPKEREENAEESPVASTTDRTRRKKRKKARASAASLREPRDRKRVWLWPVVGVAAVLVLAGAGLAWWLTSRPQPVPPPEEPLAVAPVSLPEPAPTPPTQPKETPKATEATTPKPPPPTPPPAPPPTPPPEEKPKPWKKLPVPDEVSQARAEKTLKETYQTDYAGTKPEDKLALAAKFLQPGRENRADPAAWYVLLREARDLAVQAGRPRLALEAIREIDKWFLIDAWTMEMTAMTTLGQSVSDKNARVVVSVALGKLLDQAMTGEHYSSAKELLGIADAAAAKVVKDKKSAEVDKQLTERIAARKQEVADLEKDYQAVQDARTKLDSTPDDPQANLTLGKYLCFFQGKWEEGLPLLAKGADDHLKELAKKDLAQPKEAADQAAVASGWLALVEGEKGRNQVHLKERGLFWFEKAEPKAEGLTKTLITDQLKQLRQPPPPIPPRLMLGSFYGRDLEDRVLLLREGGGTMQSEEAVARGLEWLARHQAPTGMWSLDAFPTLGGCNCADVGEKHDIAATAFGLLPFLGAGETHLQGSHAPTVLRGLNYLLFQQKPTGNFSDNAYENALATLAVCEAYGLSQDVRLRVPAQAAVNYIIQAQDSGGSWGYSAGQAGDTSVSGWQFSALKAGVYAGLKVPLDPFNRLEHFLDTVADPDGLGYGYKTPGSGKATSAVGLLCRQYLGWGPDKPTLVKGLEQLVQTSNLPTKDNHSIYFIFYATQALHHFGGQPWEAWNGKVRDLLVDLQDQGLDPTHPHQKGSWSPRGDDYAPQGGRFMFTSLAVMSLEMYYYSVPVNGYGPAVLPD